MNLPTVGLLGGGQLGRMLLESANRLNARVVILDAAGSSAKQIAGVQQHLDGSFKDSASIRKLASQSDVLTVEIEHVDVDVLEELEREEVQVNPSAQTLRVIQDKYLQKQHLIKYQLPVVDSIQFKSFEKTETELGLPFMLKSKKQAYDGKGNFVVKSRSDFASLKVPSASDLYAERWAPFTCELAVMVIKTQYDRLEIASNVPSEHCTPFPTVTTVHENSICKLVYAPAWNISPETAAEAQRLAVKAVATFTGKGVFGVEMFLLEDGKLLINEIAPRPHNSGHYTIEACTLSQYEAQLRSILNKPIPINKSLLRSPDTHAIMINLLGAPNGDCMQVANAALGVNDAHIHLYGKGESRVGRKMGHITIIGNSPEDVWQKAEPLIRLDERIHLLTAGRYELPRPWGPCEHPRKQVGITMGSHSDLERVKPGLQILKDLDIPCEVRITSAHRQADQMAEYARTAASRGLRVIIAAAGGAAHLPGMLASQTPLPVIGIPIKLKALDGMDSLLSIVQMPRGVPVATVAIDNSVNAALLAARILGSSDSAIRSRVEDYAAKMQQDVNAKSQELIRIGWEKFET